MSSDDVGRRFGKPSGWVAARTGIRTMARVGAPDELRELARIAAQRALADAGVAAHDLDLTIAASCSADGATSVLGTSVASALRVRGAHLDVNAACSGFCYAVASADALIRAGSARHVLVVAAESMTAIVDPDDLPTAIVFGDGAGAAVLGPADADDPGIGPVVWGSDGGRASLIECDARGYLRMRGQEVFRWAVEAVPDIAREACERAKVGLRDIDVFVPHQANLRIIEAVVRRLELRPDVVVADDVVESGNTSAASVPIALDKLRRAGRLPSGGLALLVGFGAGLAHAAQVVRLP